MHFYKEKRGIISLIYLTRSALVYAANICEELPKYQVGIAVQSMSALSNLVDVIRMNTEDGEAIFRVTSANGSVLFTNGSRIDIFLGKENSRGKKFNLLIIDSAINKEWSRRVLIPMEAWDYDKVRLGV